MLGISLKRLADAAEISKLDLNPRGLTLAPRGGATLAWFSGTYAGCGIMLPVDSALTAPVSVTATDFPQLASLFEDDQEVKFTPQKSALMLSAGRRRVSLQYLGSPDTEGYDRLVAEATFVAHTKLADLAREATAAAQVSAVTLTVPILTGVRLLAAGKAIGLQAANGSTLVFETTFAATAEGKIDLVAPAQDLLTALRTLGSGDVSIGAYGDPARALVLKSSDAIVKLPRITGQWPDLKRVKDRAYAESLSLPAASVRALALAARTYAAEGLVTIRPTESKANVVLETKESEKGQFQEVVSGDVSRAYKIDVSDLEVALKICGQTLEVTFAPEMARIIADARKLYILLKG